LMLINGNIVLFGVSYHMNIHITNQRQSFAFFQPKTKTHKNFVCFCLCMSTETCFSAK